MHRAPCEAFSRQDSLARVAGTAPLLNPCKRCRGISKKPPWKGGFGHFGMLPEHCANLYVRWSSEEESHSAPISAPLLRLGGRLGYCFTIRDLKRDRKMQIPRQCISSLSLYPSLLTFTVL